MTLPRRLLGEQPQAKVAALLAAALFAVLPLVVWPPSDDSYVIPKWTALAFGVLLLLGASLVAACRRLPLRIGFHPVNGLLAGLLLWLWLSGLWAESGELAALRARRVAWAAAAVLLVQSIIIGRRDRVLYVLRAVMGASLLAALWVLAVDYREGFAPGGLPLRRVLGDWRDAISTVAFGNSGHVADFLAVGFLAWLGCWILARSRALKVCAMVALWLHAAALIAAWSVHSNLSLMVGSVVLLGVLRGDRKIFRWERARRWWAGLLAGFALVVAFFVLDHPANPHGSANWGRDIPEAQGGIFAQAFSSGRWKEGGPTRLAIWYTTLAIIKDAPWVGVGAGNLVYVYPEIRTPLVLGREDLAPYAARWTNAAHNDLLQTWAELGIVGVFLLLAMVAVAFHRGAARLRMEPAGNRMLIGGGMAALAAICVQGQMSFPLELPASLLLFLLLVVWPEMIPRRGASAGAEFILPIERRFGPIRIRVRLENMQIPRELGFSLDLPKPAVWGVGIGAAVIIALLSPTVSAPLRASVACRPARTAKLQWEREFGADPRPPGAVALLAYAESGFREALAIWPEYNDCRSALSDLLVRQQRWEESLVETERTARALNAIEVPLRRAIALDALGRGDEAIAYWDAVFVRNPELGPQFPGPFQAFLQRH